MTFKKPYGAAWHGICNVSNVMCKQLLIKSEGSYVTAGEDCPLPREALSFYRGGRGWGALLRTERSHSRERAFNTLCAQQSGIPSAEAATMASLAPAMPYSLTVG